ncbi:MAG: hypothetical protein ACRCSR_08365, partial [Bacteroidales bacterium]
YDDLEEGARRIASKITALLLAASCRPQSSLCAAFSAVLIVLLVVIVLIVLMEFSALLPFSSPFHINLSHFRVKQY